MKSKILMADLLVVLRRCSSMNAEPPKLFQQRGGKLVLSTIAHGAAPAAMLAPFDVRGTLIK